MSLSDTACVENGGLSDIQLFPILASGCYL